jgi:hypothetical protein
VGGCLLERVENKEWTVVSNGRSAVHSKLSCRLGILEWREMETATVGPEGARGSCILRPLVRRLQISGEKCRI